MEFDAGKKMRQFAALWNEAVFRINTESGLDFGDHTIYLSGPKGCGRTRFAGELAKAYPNIFYFSFTGQPPEQALALFQEMYLPTSDPVADWEKAADAFMKLPPAGAKLIIWEDENNEAKKACWGAFKKHYSWESASLLFCEITDEEEDPARGYVYNLRYLTPAEFCRLFPGYAKEDVVRLYGMTAGFPAVAKELDPERSYEENLRILLAYDSGFSTYLPQLVRESFRSPESYYPIIAGIARGKHRLSEIAKEAGFPNNKCGTYLDALIKAGFVREEKDGSGPWARYYLANSYYIAWGRYVYGKQNLQLVMPDTFLQIVSESLDEAVALPGLHAACLRYVTAAYEEKFLYDSIDFEIEPEQIKRSVLTELEDGSTVTIDYYASMEGDSIFAIFPHALSERFGKEEYERIEDAVKRHEGLNTACIFLFSVHRFSDWIVHRVARNPLRYAVTLERLKY